MPEHHKRSRARASVPVPDAPRGAGSKGFATRDQRLPESPPLRATGNAAPGLMATVRARYRDAVNTLFGSPPRVLNASCSAVVHAAPRSNAPQPEPQAKRARLSSRGDTTPADQVVPGGLGKAQPCQKQKTCRCAESLWPAGGVGPELMLRTAEELSERTYVLYRKAVDPETSDVDYSSLVHSDDFHQYLVSARKLRYFDPLLLSVAERKAFFLNVYNSLMIHAIAVTSKPRTMYDRISLYNSAAYNIGGRDYTLNMIEHGVLRSNRAGNGPFAQVPLMESDARIRCVLPDVDPRIHFALNCGARSCPAVRFYAADNLDRTLDSATHTYLMDVEVDMESRTITLPKLLQWYRADFSESGTVDAMIRWTLPYLESEKKELVNTLLHEKEQGLEPLKILYGEYDWTVNDASA